MPEGEPGFLDRLVERTARAMDAVGLSGTRLRWRWNRRRRELGEAGLRTEIVMRGARTQHKMCPACRALVPRSASTCTECGAALSAVRAPGVGRLVSNMLPGATAATSLILLANGALFLLMLTAAMKSGRGAGLFAAFDGLTMVRFGSGYNPLTLGQHEWWRLVTPVFLHAGLIHFAFNSYALLQLGPLVEQEFGTERFAVAYLFCGITGNVASQILWPGFRNTLGASGAICGLVGLLLVYGHRRGGAAGAAIRSSMMQSALLVLMMSFFSGIDLLCHLGGFAGGLALGWILPIGPFRSRASTVAWEAAAIGALVLVMASFWLVASHPFAMPG